MVNGLLKVKCVRAGLPKIKNGMDRQMKKPHEILLEHVQTNLTLKTVAQRLRIIKLNKNVPTLNGVVNEITKISFQNAVVSMLMTKLDTDKISAVDYSYILQMNFKEKELFWSKLWKV